MIENITPDGYIGIQVSSTRNEASKVWAERLAKEIQANSSYPVTEVEIPGMGAAAGPGPDIVELIKNAFDIAGYLGAAWTTEQLFRRKIREKIDKKAKDYGHNREYLHIVLTHGGPVPGSVLRKLTIRDLVSLLPTLRETMKEMGNCSLMLMGMSKWEEQINFFGLKAEDLQGKPLRRMIKIAETEKGPVGYSSDDLNMFIFKPNPKLY